MSWHLSQGVWLLGSGIFNQAGFLFLHSPIKNDTAFLAPCQTVYTSAQDSPWCKGSGSNVPEKWKWWGPTVPVKVLRKALNSVAGLFPCECSPTGRWAKAHTVIRKQVIEQTWTEASDFLPSTRGFLKGWKNLGWALDLRAILSSLFKDPSSPEVYFGQVLNKQTSKHLIHSQGSENQESPVVTQGKNAGTSDRVTGGQESRLIYMMRRQTP